MIVGIHHVALGVSDFEKALKFYTEGLGFEIVQESEFDNSPEVDQAVGLVNAKARMAMLKGPNAFLELWQYTNPEPKDLRSRPCDYGYPHFALHGMEFVGDVVHFGNTSSAIYGRDPCGNVIELYEIKAPEIAQLER
jgi:glyoxylase I family protein